MAHVAVGEIPLQQPGRFRDQRVPPAVAEGVVVRAHLRQLEAAHHGLAGHIHRPPHQRVGLGDEIAHARQAGELVDLGGAGVGHHAAFHDGGPQDLLVYSVLRNALGPVFLALWALMSASWIIS